MKLYSYWRSSAAFRVRIALNLKGCEYELVPVHLTRNGGEQRTREFRRVNPQGLVPMLDHDGIVLTQSLAIIEYLDAVYESPALIPKEPAERARVQSLAQVVACDIHPINNLRVREYLRDELGQDAEGVDRWQRRWIADGFRALEAHVAASGGGRYCWGERVTIADVLLVPQMYNARRLNCDLTPYPALCSVAAHLEKLEPFERAAPENQPDAEP